MSSISEILKIPESIWIEGKPYFRCDHPNQAISIVRVYQQLLIEKLCKIDTHTLEEAFDRLGGGDFQVLLHNLNRPIVTRNNFISPQAANPDNWGSFQPRVRREIVANIVMIGEHQIEDKPDLFDHWRDTGAVVHVTPALILTAPYRFYGWTAETQLYTSKQIDSAGTLTVAGVLALIKPAHYPVPSPRVKLITGIKW